MNSGIKKKIVNKIFKINYLPYQIRSEIFDVCFNLKKSSRIILDYNNNLSKIAEQLIDIGLFVSVSKGYILHKKKNKKFSDWFVLKGKNTKKMLCFYIAKTQKLANLSRIMDKSKNDEKFGKILGYPKCCVNYVKKKGRPPTIQESYDKYLFKNKKYNPFLWPPAMIKDAYLISHFPCTKTCKISLALAKKKMVFNKKICKFENSKSLQKSIKKIIYTKKK